ncbi:hypothetical protein E3226_002295 [Legionella geestiana]|uniref:hypothetical protein n=1 Tax=Legionella geestiana TaxID=45065 RepID=UPI001091C2CB|nr:hypothetical protein [Legionella geestiana]QDQ39319.1 hypothetical protein E3226_002295 [Legionella geestiana]
MAWLVLDLDLTVLAAQRDESKVDTTFHTLSHPDTVVVCDRSYEVKLINADKLVKLINHACDHHEGVIFLTAGAWNEEDLLDYLYFALDGLSAKAYEALGNAPVLNALNAMRLHPERDFNGVRHLAKNIRLDAWLKRSGQTLCSLDSRFVVVDDHPRHTDSFRGHTHVTAIHATTCTSDIEELGIENPLAFYDEAMQALSMSAKMEQDALQASPAKKATSAQATLAQSLFFRLTELKDAEDSCASSSVPDSHPKLR